MTITIKIQKLFDEITLNIYNIKIVELKNKIKDITGINSTNQLLIYNGIQLHDNKYIEDYIKPYYKNNNNVYTIQLYVKYSDNRSKL